MRHLDDADFVDWLDGTLGPAPARHLEQCGQCRTRAGEVRDALVRTAEADVPEPSPLFWDHFQARVRAAVGAEAIAATAWMPALRPAAWAGGAVLAFLLVFAVVTWRADDPATPPQAAPAANSSALAKGLETDDLEADEAWALVRTVADDVEWDEAQAAGLSARPGSAEHAALALTAAEQSELAQLLAAELKRAGA